MARFCRAFTLIELLVVIAIIAIIAGVLFPVFAFAKASSRKVTCISNMRQIGMASSLYSSEYDSTYVIVNHQPASEPNSRNDRTWVQLLLPYLKTFSVFRCPGDSSNGPRPEATFDQDLVPGDLYSQYYTASLRTNAGYNFQFLSPVMKLGGVWQPRPKTESAISDMSRMLVFIDSAWQVQDGRPSGGGSWLVSPPCRYESINGRMVDTITESAGVMRATTGDIEVYEPVQGWDVQNMESSNQSGNVFLWHGNRANVAAADGSARSLTMDQITDGCALLPNWRGPIVEPRLYKWNPR